jgi:glycosyltransferase involved in cell wall biosynthesis
MPGLKLENIPREQYRISVLLPVYSETQSVKDIVRWLQSSIAGYLKEIIIILSPNSSEDSKKICGELAGEYGNIRVHVQVNNPGLGNAVREGYKLATGNLILSMDSDGEMENETVLKMIDEMAGKNCDLVVGSRWAAPGGFAGYSPVKYILNWGFQKLFRVLYRTKIHDLTLGFKLLRSEIAKRIKWQSVFHEIGCESTLKPIRLGMRVSEVPTRWTKRVKGASKSSFMKNFRYVAMACGILIGGVSLEQD